MQNRNQIRLIRHGESFANIGQHRYDAPLTNQGMEQAKSLIGSYDFAVISPMRRTLETCWYSKINYKDSEINGLCREIITKDSDCLLYENLVLETEIQFAERMGMFENYLYELSKKYNNIVVFTHGHVIKFLTKSPYFVTNCESRFVYFD